MPRKKKAIDTLPVVDAENKTSIKNDEQEKEKMIDNENIVSQNQNKEKNETVVNTPIAKNNEVKDEQPAVKENSKKKRKTQKENDGSRDTRALLVGAAQTKRIITGMLEGLEYDENVVDGEQAVRAILYNDSYRIVIPASQMGIMVPENISNQEKVSLYRKYIGAMIGATINYVILGVDKKEHLAIGSRKFAMGIERKANYVSKYHGMNVSRMEHCLGAQIPVEARVMSVSGSVVRLDLCGVECKVYAKEAAWRYTANLSDLFCPGDIVKVMLKNIDRDENGNIAVEASIRDAVPNHQAENVLKYKVDSLYVGVVSGINEKGYYIDIGDSLTGITVFCTSIHGQEVPQIGDKVSCQIVKVDESSGFAMAKITRIIQKASRNRLR